MILARNFDCRNNLQKTLKQFGPEAKIANRNNCQYVSLRGRVCSRSAICFSKVRLSLPFYRRNFRSSFPEI